MVGVGGISGFFLLQSLKSYSKEIIQAKNVSKNFIWVIICNLVVRRILVSARLPTGLKEMVEPGSLIWNCHRSLFVLPKWGMCDRAMQEWHTLRHISKEDFFSMFLLECSWQTVVFQIIKPHFCIWKLKFLNLTSSYTSKIICFKNSQVCQTQEQLLFPSFLHIPGSH